MDYTVDKTEKKITLPLTSIFKVIYLHIVKNKHNVYNLVLVIDNCFILQH